PGATAQANRRRYSLVAMAIGALIVVGATALFFTARTTFRTATGRTETASVSTPPRQEKSIAVLPFQNLSDDKSHAYFSEAIQDEILTRLSNVTAHRAIARTYTM